MESSRRDLLNDMAEHESILKNNQNTCHPRFGFTSKTSIAFPKTGCCFYCADRSHILWRLHQCGYDFGFRTADFFYCLSPYFVIAQKKKSDGNTDFYFVSM